MSGSSSSGQQVSTGVDSSSSAAFCLKVRVEAGSIPLSLSATEQQGAAAATAAAASVISWPVVPSIPLGSAHNLESLRSALQQTSIDHLYLVASAVDEMSSTSVQQLRQRVLDPSFTALELDLTPTAPYLLLTANPPWPKEAYATVPPFSSAGVRFSQCGDRLAIVGHNGRRITKLPGPETWSSSVALASTSALDESFRRITYRVFMADRDVTAAAESAVASDTTASSGAPSSTSRSSTSLGETIPRVLVGLADATVPLDQMDRVSGSYPRGWFVDVVTGAIYGGSPTPGGVPGRPIAFVDSHYYRVDGVVEITLELDAAKAQMIVLSRGQRVALVQLARHVVDALYPVVEIYTVGAMVQLL